MSWLRFIERPRALALLSLALALVPAGLAVMTYRDARQKDERVYQTTAQVLGEQMQAMFQQHTYYPIECRNQAVKVEDPALTQGKMMVPFDWRMRLPHLLALGYAQRVEDKILLRWKEERELAMAQLGDDLMQVPGVRAMLNDGQPPSSSITRGRLLEQHRLLVLLALPDVKSSNAPRGYVVAWIDLDGICHSGSLPSIRDGVLTATFLDEKAVLPANAHRADMHDGSAKWSAAITRGPKFAERYGAPAPWLSFIAVGLSAVPLLLLASLATRSTRLHAELSAEREVVRQQRFFTQSVSHEFRTPLGIIMSGADLLDDYLDHLTPERRREVLGEIKGNTRLMSDMVEQVLTLGRVESGRLPFNPQPMNVASLCREIARKAEAMADNERVIEVIAPEAEAKLDASLVTSILDNLLANALKYSPRETPVKLCAGTDGDRVAFTVSDQGIGIPKEEIARVCDPFHRGANVGERQGTGLGLAIAQRCVELHGGTMRIESEEARGTTITVTLPVA